MILKLMFPLLPRIHVSIVRSYNRSCYIFIEAVVNLLRMKTHSISRFSDSEFEILLIILFLFQPSVGYGYTASFVLFVIFSFLQKSFILEIILVRSSALVRTVFAHSRLSSERSPS